MTAAIPGARNAEQARSNAAAGSLELPADLDATIHDLYDRWFRATVHERW